MPILLGQGRFRYWLKVKHMHQYLLPQVFPQATARSVPPNSSSHPTLKLWAMNREVLTQASFAEERNNTAHIPSSNIWVLGPSRSKTHGEYPEHVNSTCACRDCSQKHTRQRSPAQAASSRARTAFPTFEGNCSGARSARGLLLWPTTNTKCPNVLRWSH